MSSCPYFQDFQPIARLDKFVSGIPNAIPNNQRSQINVAADAGPRLPLPGTPIESAKVIAVGSRVRRRE